MAKLKASRVALKDISEYLGTTNQKPQPDVVTPLHLETKETRRLNKILDIHKVNKGKVF